MDTQKTLTSGPEPKEFTERELDEALYDLDDICARCQMPYFVDKITAKALVDEVPLYGDGIYAVIRRNEYRKEVKGTISTYQPDVVFDGENGFSYEFMGVPVRVRIVEQDDPFFTQADFRWHKSWQYNIANPWTRYVETI